jgi:hypothetical protein
MLEEEHRVGPRARGNVARDRVLQVERLAVVRDAELEEVRVQGRPPNIQYASIGTASAI